MKEKSKKDILLEEMIKAVPSVPEKEIIESYEETMSDKGDPETRHMIEGIFNAMEAYAKQEVTLSKNVVKA